MLPLLWGPEVNISCFCQNYVFFSFWISGIWSGLSVSSGALTVLLYYEGGGVRLKWSPGGAVGSLASPIGQHKDKDKKWKWEIWRYRCLILVTVLFHLHKSKHSLCFNETQTKKTFKAIYTVFFKIYCLILLPLIYRKESKLWKGEWGRTLKRRPQVGTKPGPLWVEALPCWGGSSTNWATHRPCIWVFFEAFTELLD